MGVDQTIVLLRNKAKEIFDVDEIEEHPFKCMKTLEIGGSRKLGQSTYIGEFQPFLVALAGEVYPGLALIQHSTVKIRNGKSVHIPAKTTITYDNEEAQRILDATAKSLEMFSWDANSKNRKLRKERLRQHMASTVTTEQTNWLIDHQAPILTTHWNRSRSGKTVVRINHALLKDIEFFKCLDPATTHMRLADFISGVLPSNRETLEISDKDKIRKAGFDTITSFRKPPQKKARR